ncbi:MAG: TerC family protein [Alphaproteobacteria bacterium]|nr:TerC family protein [Alphaproteobacteria bacterium]
MEWLSDPNVWASLLTLTALEIVLGVDNLVFIAILSNRLPQRHRASARRLGLGFALLTRLMLLATLAWIIGLTQPIFEVFGKPLSWRDIILIVGGGFLLYKGTHEIHTSLEGEDDTGEEPESAASVAQRGFVMTIVQIGIVDIVFSLDSVITAVGMADQLWIMITAVVLAMAVMVLAANPLSNFVSAHPTVKMLALAFLILIGTHLVADGFGFHIPKGYIYTAMAFSVAVEALNLSARRRRARAVKLHRPPL